MPEIAVDCRPGGVWLGVWLKGLTMAVGTTGVELVVESMARGVEVADGPSVEVEGVEAELDGIDWDDWDISRLFSAFCA